jgi:predicted enzyme related to lactoylglutathione lyase
MHKSRPGEITIDCYTDNLEEAQSFWSAALDLKAQRYEDPELNAYYLETEANEIDINMQMVKHESRVHIDIETDDIEAEVKRVEQLGAKKYA